MTPSTLIQELVTEREAHRLTRERLEAVEDELTGAIEERAGARALLATAEASWRCYYCGEVFRDKEQASAHFGESAISETHCQIDAAKHRAMEDELSRYRAEDTDLHRQIENLRAEHAQALRREEERGYAKGLADGGVLSARAEKAEDLKNRYKAAFLRWVGFLKAWRTRAEAAEAERDALKDESDDRLNMLNSRSKDAREYFVRAEVAEAALAEKEKDRQYHMNQINRLAAHIGALGRTSEDVVSMAFTKFGLDELRADRAESALREKEEQVKAYQEWLESFAASWDQHARHHQSCKQGMPCDCGLSQTRADLRWPCPANYAALEKTRTQCDSQRNGTRCARDEGHTGNHRSMRIPGPYGGDEPTPEKAKCPTCAMPGIPHEPGCHFDPNGIDGDNHRRFCTRKTTAGCNCDERRRYFMGEKPKPECECACHKDGMARPDGHACEKPSRAQEESDGR